MHVAVDITFMNTVCVCNSGLLRNYAKLSEKTFRLVHLVKIWARNNDLISSSDNGFTFPTSYAWVLMAIYFMQVRLHAVPRLFKLDGPVEDVWGCRSSTFVNRACVGDLGSSSFTRNAPSSPLTLFTLFLHFLAHEADDLVMDIATLNAHADRKDSPLHVLDPIEIGRVVTKNVTSEHWEFIKTNAAMYLERLERIGSYGSFLDVVSTSHREPRSHTTVGVSTVSDLVDLYTGSFCGYCTASHRQTVRLIMGFFVCQFGSDCGPGKGAKPFAALGVVIKEEFAQWVVTVAISLFLRNNFLVEFWIKIYKVPQIIVSCILRRVVLEIITVAAPDVLLLRRAAWIVFGRTGRFG